MKILNNVIFILLLSFQAKSQYFVVENVGNLNLHFSFENKYGEVVGEWIEPNDMKKIDFSGKNVIVTFEYNGYIAPTFIENKDSIKIYREENKYIITDGNKEIWDSFQILSKKYKIVLSPFFGITYDKNLKYTAVREEIDKFRDDRLQVIRNSKLNPINTALFKDYINARYYDEILAPYYNIEPVPENIKNEILTIINQRLKSNFSANNFSQAPGYYFRFFKYLFIIKNVNDPYEIVTYLKSIITEKDVLNHIIYRFFKDETNTKYQMIYKSYILDESNDKGYKSKVLR
jgi:hypothetical protein